MNTPNVPTLTPSQRERIENSLFSTLQKYNISNWDVDFNSVWQTLSIRGEKTIPANCRKQILNNCSYLGMDIIIL